MYPTLSRQIRFWNAFYARITRASRGLRLDLNYIFSLRYQRTVGHDHVVQANPRVQVQLPPLTSGRGLCGQEVDVCHQPNRRLSHLPGAAITAHRACASRVRSGWRAEGPQVPRSVKEEAGAPVCDGRRCIQTGL